MKPEENEDWAKAYNEAIGPLAWEHLQWYEDMMRRGSVHYAEYGHWITDPFIKTCLMCGKDW